MSNKPFFKEAEAFADEMAELIKVYEDGDEPDERYSAFTKEFSRKIIAATALTISHEQYNDAYAALRLVANIKAYDGEPFEGSIDSWLDEGILHVMKPKNTLKFLMAEGVHPQKSMILNGVTITFEEALRIFDVFDALAAGVSHSIFYKGIYSDEWDLNNMSGAIGYNPIQKPKML
ncbi:hypothetical protein V4100_000981 [Pseudomonas aeruginosa]